MKPVTAEQLQDILRQQKTLLGDVFYELKGMPNLSTYGADKLDRLGAHCAQRFDEMIAKLETKK